jgi:hypothetical protein
VFSAWAGPDETMIDAMQIQGMAKRRETYMKEAANRFLENSPFQTPADAVEAGARSISEWCDHLNLARARYGLQHEPLETDALWDEAQAQAA